ncbi:MAG: MFS transporter [Myxococcota bacterium]|nr:MFS transporter [Myxococcota bacterium]
MNAFLPSASGEARGPSVDGTGQRGGSLRERFTAGLEDRGSYPSWVLVAALAGMFATTFPITILTVALGIVAAEFGVSQDHAAWVISGPMLLSAVALPLLGKLGDLYGHRRTFLFGFAASTVTAALTAIAWDLGSLIGLRTLAAVLGGATGPSSMALIFAVTAREKRVSAMGWWSFTGAAAPALGLVAGGPLVEWLGWRVVFVLQAGISVAALLLAWLVLRETPRQRVRFDLLGAGTLAVGVAGLMWALGRVRTVGLESLEIAGGVLLGVVMLAAFVQVERRAVAPLLPLSFFSLRNFSAPIVSNAFMGAAYMGAFVVAPLLLLEVFEYSLSAAAGIMLMRTLSLTIASPFGGRLGTRFGERAAAVIGAGIMTLSLAILAVASIEASLPLVVLGLVLQGTGHGLALPSLTSSVSNAVPEADLGIASAANRLTGQVGASFGITFLALVYGGAATGSAFAGAFAAGAVLSAGSLAGAVAMARGRAS